MNFAASFVTALVALLHLYFLVLEMFLWTKPYGRRVFQLTPEKAEETKTLADVLQLGHVRFLSARHDDCWKKRAAEEAAPPRFLRSRVGFVSFYSIKLFSINNTSTTF